MHILNGHTVQRRIDLGNEKKTSTWSENLCSFVASKVKATMQEDLTTV